MLPGLADQHIRVTTKQETEVRCLCAEIEAPTPNLGHPQYDSDLYARDLSKRLEAGRILAALVRVILGLCLALLLVGCTEQPAYDQGTLVVGRNVAVEDVQRAADYWNDRGAMWVVSETCDWEPCVPVYYGEICPGGEPMAACMLWDGADGLRIVLESETYDGIMDPALMIAHEVGHVMGLGHTPNSVMAESDRQGFNWGDP